MARDPATLGVSLGTRLAAIMARSRAQSTTALLPFVRAEVARTVSQAAAGFRGGDLDTVKQVLEENFGTSPIDPKTVDIIDGLYNVHPILATPIVAVALGLSMFRLLGAAADPFVARVQQTAYQANPTQALDAGTAAQAFVRGFLTFEDGRDEAARSGFGADRWRLLTQLAEQRLQLTELFALRNRGVITDGGLRQGVLELGFDEPTSRLITELRHVVPGPQDVVRFAVRDVYRPEAVSRGGLLQDLPAAGLEDAERAGLTGDDFRKFWAAHWVLPSLTNAFEMFHRGVITEGELRGLLRTQDIAPGWRDELISIAFNVITRVDIRRMYREGIADERKVLETYLAQGYTREDAEALTEFAIADATTDARELTKTEVVQLYEAGAVQRGEAEGMLRDLGFQAAETEWLLVLAEFRRFRRFRELAVSRVRSRYSGRRITESEASTALDRLGVAPGERDALIDIWDAERDAERPILTSAMIGRLFRDGIIAEDEARVRWGRLGYRSDDIDLLVLNYEAEPEEPEEGGAKRRQLTKSDIGRALREGTIPVEEAIRQWMELGYSEADAAILASNYLPDEEV